MLEQSRHRQRQTGHRRDAIAELDRHQGIHAEVAQRLTRLEGSPGPTSEHLANRRFEPRSERGGPIGFGQR